VSPSPDLILETERLYLRPSAPDMAESRLRFEVRNREEHARFNTPYATEFFQLDFWKQRLAMEVQDLHEDRACCLSLFLREPPGKPQVIGTCNFTKFVRGRFQACYLGYHIDHAYEGQGYMSEALRGATKFAFETLHMHRIMANCVPENEPSRRLLKRLGFVEEGLPRNYLYVGGEWSDHVLTSLTNPDPQPPQL
jgi:ribosomal-protein-alanine N-acetyltransferase